MPEPCKVFVGNLSYDANEDELRKLFSKCGAIDDIVIIYDRESGRSRGFGFVTFQDPSSAKQAIDTVNGTEFLNRDVTVREAESKREGGGGGGGGRFRGGGGGYGGGGGGYGGGGGGYGGSGGGYGGGGGNYRSGGGGRDYNDRY